MPAIKPYVACIYVTEMDLEAQKIKLNYCVYYIYFSTTQNVSLFIESFLNNYLLVPPKEIVNSKYISKGL